MKKDQQYYRLLHKKNHPEYYTAHARKGRHLKQKYGITQEQFDSMYRQQNGCCAICGKPETATLHGKLVSLSVDHNHKTGKVRALLCQKHNRALGLLGEDFDVALQLAKYIQTHNNVI